MRISLYRAGAGFLAGVLLAVLTGCRAEPAMSGEAEVTSVLMKIWTMTRATSLPQKGRPSISYRIDRPLMRREM